MMRAKELLILGSTLLRSTRGIRNNGEGGGCALGMMSAAKGDVHTAIEHFPGYRWLMDNKAVVPCWCATGGAVGSITGIITHIFDCHIHGDHTWTLDQLATWLDIYDQTPQLKMLPAAPVEVVEAASFYSEQEEFAVR